MPVFRDVVDMVVYDGRTVAVGEDPPEQVHADAQADRDADQHGFPASGVWLDQPCSDRRVDRPKDFREEQEGERETRRDRSLWVRRESEPKGPSMICWIAKKTGTVASGISRHVLIQVSETIPKTPVSPAVMKLAVAEKHMFVVCFQIIRALGVD
jgi:hypothetical protein